MINKYNILILAFSITCSLFGNNADHLLIKRVATNPNNSEAVFLYNPTNYSINLNNPDGGSYFLTDDAHFINSQSNKHYTNIPFVKDGYTIRNANLWNSGIVNVGSFVFSFKPSGLDQASIRDAQDNILLDLVYLNDIQCDPEDLDECGLCNGPGIPNTDCDCFGNQFDCKGVCGGGSTDLDDDGICDELDNCFIGNGLIDSCGICNGDNLSCVDCNGVINGYAYLDGSNNCVGGNTDLVPVNEDCNGDIGGLAFLDRCENCVMGNTGIQPCQQDCFNIWGGSAVVDECGVCGGDGPADGYDCSSNCIEEIDACGVCAGSNFDAYVCDYGMNENDILSNDNYIYLSYDNSIWINITDQSITDFENINFKLLDGIIIKSTFEDNNISMDKEFWRNNFNDFFIQFPENTIINPGETQIISMHADSIFNDYYHYYPDYNIHDLKTNGVENFDGNNQVFDYLSHSGNNGESLMLFYWNGVSDIIEDVDYFLWGSRGLAVDKTDISGYLPDQNPDFQTYLDNTINHFSYNRILNQQNLYIELGETNPGNGITGHDETSENLNDSWLVNFNQEKTLGCMDNSNCSGVDDGYCARNYDENADVDFSEIYDTVDYTTNNRCIYNYGCMDLTKFNYDSEATKEYSSCIDDSVYELKTVEQVVNGEVPVGNDVLVSGKLVGFRLIQETFWILTLRDDNNFQVDVTGSGWNIETSKLNYLVDPHNYTEHIVSILGVVDEYQGSYQIQVDSERKIDDYIRYYRDGEFIEDYAHEFISTEIIAAPYVIIPSQGERLDFQYSFPSNSRVIIRVLSLDGRVITTLLDRFYDSPGTVMRVDDLSDWDGRDHLGQVVAPGTYLFHIEASNFTTGSTSVDVCPVVVGVNH